MLRQQISYDQNLAYLGEWRGASSAGGGTALTTTPALIRIPQRTRFLMAYARNFATAVVAQVALCPYLAVLKTADLLASVSDSSDDLQDGAAGTVLTLNSLDTFANGDFLLIGAHQPFRGVDVTIVNANGNASVLSVNYWNGSAWTNITPTDGTILTGATFGQSGRVTWTTPAAWVDQKISPVQHAPVHIATGRKVITAGSTLRGEEAILLEIFSRLRKKYPGLVLIIAPRHPERFDEVSGLITSAGYECQRRTRLKGPVRDVILLDTIGELRAFYSVCDIAFVGGSLVKVGGHNLLNLLQRKNQLYSVVICSTLKKYLRH